MLRLNTFIVYGHVQSTYPSTYHYVNERRGTHAYVMPRSITFMDFRYRKWKFLNFLKIIFGPRNVHGKGHFHLRSAAFVYVTPLFSTYLIVRNYTFSLAWRNVRIRRPVFRQCDWGINYVQMSYVQLRS